MVLLHMVLTFMPSSIYAMWLIYGCSGNHYVYINFNFLSFVCSLYHLSKTKISFWILVLNQLSTDGGTGELTSSDFSMWPWQCASASIWSPRSGGAPAETLCFYQNRPVPTGRGNFGPVSLGIWPKPSCWADMSHIYCIISNFPCFVFLLNECSSWIEWIW